MTPNDFIAKWRNVELKERTASQTHFLDLCRLLEIQDPVSADPKGEWFTFEKGASKTTGGEGWADVWRKGCFAWEYKGKNKDLDKAFTQLLQYSIALENPPLLIVSDMDQFRIHTNWTNTVQVVHKIALEDLADAAKRDMLLSAFTNPDALKPAKTRQMLTEQAAEEFAALAQRLRSRGHAPDTVAHFVNRLVFCMFAEDVRLLPDHMFTAMLKASDRNPASFATHASTLFGAMNGGGLVGFTQVEWFNGGLFDDNSALPLEADDIENLLKAAKLDWSEIDPSILGTLFERGLDPDKRSQLGAHYTDRDKIMQIVRPVIIAPLEAEWESARTGITAAMERAQTAKGKAASNAEGEAKRIKSDFLERLAKFRVLDPACGSGNFLNLSLIALKDIEHRANLEAEVLGLPREFPRVGPECVLGIELNHYAAELARVSVWIGEIQWMRRNGFDAAKNPILRNLDTIECRDAVLAWETSPLPFRGGAGGGACPDGAALEDSPHPNPSPEGEGLKRRPVRAKWPAADVVVGNPPFLGGSKILAELGDEYTGALRKAWGSDVPGFADLVCYWFAKAFQQMSKGRLTRAGLVSTNSIRGGANREVLKPIVEHGRIFEAWSDEGWTVDGAAVRVSLIAFEFGAEGSLGPHQRPVGSRADDEVSDASPPTRRPVLDTGLGFSRQPMLDGCAVGTILSDLTANESGIDLTKAHKIPENTNICFEGFRKYGPLDVTGDVAREWLAAPLNVNGLPNSKVLFPYLGGRDIAERNNDVWVIDFFGYNDIDDAAHFEKPFEYALSNAKPYRDGVRDSQRREKWWQFGRTGSSLRTALQPLTRMLVTARVSKYRLFKWVELGVRPSDATNAIARDDDTSFGILHSRFHELWSLRMGTSLEDRPRYTPSTTFETFPFPAGLTPNIPAADYAADPRAIAIAGAAARLNALRENWLNPEDLIIRTPEVVPGYPDRILPRDAAAAVELKKRTLTNLYNARPAWLDNAHKALDLAVAEAYGWGDDWRAGAMTDDEILARLFRLNQERAAND